MELPPVEHGLDACGSEAQQGVVAGVVGLDQARVLHRVEEGVEVGLSFGFEEAEGGERGGVEVASACLLAAEEHLDDAAFAKAGLVVVGVDFPAHSGDSAECFANAVFFFFVCGGP